MKVKTSELAHSAADCQALTRVAKVKGRCGLWFLLESMDPSLTHAMKAASCLSEPANGDLVLVCSSENYRNHYIISILSASEASVSTVILSDGIRLSSRDGRLKIETQRLTICAEEKLSIASSSIYLTSRALLLRSQHLRARLSSTVARIYALQMHSVTVLATCRRLFVKARDSFRWVERMDDTRAGRINLSTEETIKIRSASLTMRASDNVKIDGKHIDLG
ncbi:hypothetical protein A3780_20405 [Kosakonia radicincitans]|uniref:DUF3540 domain-containing protein n=1 Tax=Kosakonia TaxID=1330547 RepID=UPI000903DB2B|nr:MULTISPECIES: DUF3540 domain-containing protein [Kosakonia]APG19808.1 hypothetical protein A3780_20405 [Kosakonia radicincitans]PTA88982.1 DUF3540 domain-containing protein [Kosakonia sp. H7A]UDJ82081.1 DUF3540 domain-containing protein [Kosakonia oryzae]